MPSLRSNTNAVRPSQRRLFGPERRLCSIDLFCLHSMVQRFFLDELGVGVWSLSPFGKSQEYGIYLCAIFQKVINFDMRTWVFWFMECVPLCELFFLRIPFSFIFSSCYCSHTFHSSVLASKILLSSFNPSILNLSFHKPPNKSLK